MDSCGQKQPDYVEVKGSRRPSLWQRMRGIAVTIGVRRPGSMAGPHLGAIYPPDFYEYRPGKERYCFRLVLEDSGMNGLLFVKALYRRKKRRRDAETGG
jgi:hypothetical protein